LNGFDLKPGKMPDLVKIIGTEEGKLVFTFTKIYTVRGIMFFVSVFGRRSQSFFHIEKRDSAWKIVKATLPPDWVIKHEDELGRFIEEQIVKNT
jgi:hypothetical protein